MHLAHPGLKNPEYYVPGLPVDYVAQRYGISPDQISKLGSAENLRSCSGPGYRFEYLGRFPYCGREPGS